MMTRAYLSSKIGLFNGLMSNSVTKSTIRALMGLSLIGDRRRKAGRIGSRELFGRPGPVGSGRFFWMSDLKTGIFFCFGVLYFEIINNYEIH